MKKVPFFAVNKDSIKVISDVMETPYFQNIFKNFLVNDMKSFDFGHIQKYPFLPMPLHFRNASAASEFKFSLVAK